MLKRATGTTMTFAREAAAFLALTTFIFAIVVSATSKLPL
jgi:hypothetical protein